MKLRVVALAVPAVLLVAACGAAAGDKKSDAGSSAVAAVPQPGSVELKDANNGDLSALSTSTGGSGAAADAGSPVTTGVGADAPADQPAPDQTRAVISKGRISLRTKDIKDELFTLKQKLDDWNGTIANEESDADKSGNTRHEHLVLRVPAAKFDTAMDEISTLGTLIDRTRTSQDVTTKVIDNAVRVRTQKLSLARIQALLDQATSLNQIISIESQLSRRQAELDSLEQQQKYLADQTAESTINVYFTVPAKHAEKTAKKKDKDDGFLAGLRGGWHNLGDATNTVLHALGGFLPFGVLLVVVGIPVWFARRRRTGLAG